MYFFLLKVGESKVKLIKNIIFNKRTYETDILYNRYIYLTEHKLLLGNTLFKWPLLINLIIIDYGVG